VEEGFGSFVASAADIPAVREAVLALAVRGQFQQSGKQNVEREVRSDNSTFALPVGWSWRTVDSVTQLVTDGEHLTPPRIASGIPLVTAKNVRAGFMDLTTTDWVSREVAQKCWQRCAPKKGDILMVCVGATTGRVCVLGDTEPFVLVRSVALLRTDESQTTAAWLALFLRSPEGQRQIWANVKEQAQPCLYLNRMKGMSLPVPPLADQRRIVTTVDHLMSLLDDLEAKLRSQEETATRLAESLASAVAA
jgi:type I restriction enzyme S subunit